MRVLAHLRRTARKDNTRSGANAPLVSSKLRIMQRCRKWFTFRSWFLRKDSLPGPSRRARAPMNEKNRQMAHRRMAAKRGTLRNHGRNK
jgi:hypothetical protein